MGGAVIWENPHHADYGTEPGTSQVTTKTADTTSGAVA